MRALAAGRPVRDGGLAVARLLRFRPRPRTLAVIIGAVVVLVVGWLWVRDSALVSINRVTVVGAAGPDAVAIRSALQTATRGMTTLNVDQHQLRAALTPYPEVKSLQISAQPPHGLRIRVIEQLAVAQVVVGGRTEAVAGDGTLLGGRRASGLPQIRLTVPPGGTRVTEPTAVQAVRVLAAAPYQLLGRIGRVTSDPSHGLVAALRAGPVIYFGTAGRIHAKWLAAAAVLADPGSAGAAYIDVTDPGRPAAGTPGAAGGVQGSGSPSQSGSQSAAAAGLSGGAATPASPGATGG